MSTTSNARGLSALQRRIIKAIANHTVNIYADSGKAGGWDASYSTIRRDVTDGDPRSGSNRASFSRAVHSLVRRKLVGGLALAWVNVADQAVMGWQGGGKRQGEYRDTVPKLRLLSLTEEGWRVAPVTKTEVAR
jgi:hypothetical protein